jgi:tyrosyl-tRNA synthetase
LEKYLDFDQGKKNAAELVNNFDWFRTMHFLDFIRDVGKHITVNYMMAKDSVKKRLDGTTGMSFTEFSYQLVQGYDFYWLYTNRNCKMQMGGSDQWGNITTGTELIRRKSGGEAFAFTCPLLTKADGGKFGKTEKGNIWLDPAKTSPYQFFQFWLNATDTDAEKWIKIFTFLTMEEIESLFRDHQKNPSGRLLQKTLAKEITVFIHGAAEYELALVTTEKLFDQSGSVEKMTEVDLHDLEGIVKSEFALSELKKGVDIVRFLAETGILSSKGEARKMIQNGGISVNRIKTENLQFHLSTDLLLHEKYILVQKGKKNFYLVEVK